VSARLQSAEAGKADSIGAHGEYERRVAARQNLVGQLARRERRLSYARLIVFVAAAAVAWLAVDTAVCSPWWALLLLGLFLVFVVAHHRVRGKRERTSRAAEYYARGLSRLTGRWIGSGTGGERFQEPTHPYAEDLDLFGRGSLYELLCTARTRAGEETLAAWLKAPAAPDEIRARQQAIDELRPRVDLREELSSLGLDVRGGIDPDALEAWGAPPPPADVRGLRVAAAALVSAAAAALVGWLTIGFTSRAFITTLACEGLMGLALRARVRRTIRAVERPARELALLAHLLARIEAERFRAPTLVALRAALDADGVPPSQRVARLVRWIELLDARRNELFAPFTPLLLWTTQCALAIEAWRVHSGAAIGRWLSAVGEFEALCALAGYAYEHSEDVFPDIVDDGAPCFDSLALGHPLIPAARCVRNDVRLGADGRALIVSGSNMSGKSTLLRTVGTNAVLALMGAPVRAQRLRLSPLAVGASIRSHDSLQAGTSRFYEEISRLRQLVGLADAAVPLLFLLDEILHGTNSHDRRIGAESVLRGLLARGAIGLVTTHDLALAQLADGAEVHNVHFEDHIEDGRMAFDYRMRPGVVQKSNALALMRSIGLDV